jgi:hypothetical protein
LRHLQSHASERNSGRSPAAQQLAIYVWRNGNFVLVFSTHALTPTLSPRRGRGRGFGMGPRTQGSACAPPWATNISPPSGAWAKQSIVLVPGSCLLVAAGGSVACGDRDINSDSPWLIRQRVKCEGIFQWSFVNDDSVCLLPARSDSLVPGSK